MAFQLQLMGKGGEIVKVKSPKDKISEPKQSQGICEVRGVCVYTTIYIGWKE